MSATGFGQWNEERKARENGDDPNANTAWSFGSEQLLPLFNTEAISWDSMKTSMESQMPKKVLGMGYQQRFKVRSPSVTAHGVHLPMKKSRFLLIASHPVYM
jgi:hypothetical protein